MRNFFENVTGVFAGAPNPAIASISRFIAGGGPVFDHAAFRAYLEKSNNSGLLAAYRLPDAGELLPIEFFKDRGLLPYFCTNQRSAAKAFRSSGTTSKTQSESPFSGHGIALYRAAALQTFAAAVEASRPGALAESEGISLIPSAAVWTSSSLAQMMSWIAEEYPVTFAADDQPGVQAEALRQLVSQAKKPLWIFGTAFHFINLFDDGLQLTLPPGSFVIETGGTKGRSRSVTRHDLFATIAEMFALPQTQILSEYSMSELAAQSWDFGADRAEERRYIFPAWVDVSVLLKDGSVAREGTGALVINDPLRIDLTRPIRTEDIVHLHGRAFQILRRSTAAPLKGCSMLAERTATIGAETPHQPQKSHAAAIDHPLARAQHALNLARSIVKRESVAANFTAECGSALLGQMAADDILSSLPETAEDLAQAAERSGVKVGSAWTMLAPNNHSLAAVHPLLCAYVGGATIAAKIPDRFLAHGSFLSLLISGFNDASPGSVTILPDSYRIDQALDVPEKHGVLVFGSDESVTHLGAVLPGRVSGFGDVIAVACGVLRDVKANADAIVRDFFSLRQSGCMSARAFFLEQNDAADLKIATEQLAAAAAAYAQALSVDDVAALHGERIRYETLFAAHDLVHATSGGEPLVTGFTWTKDLLPDTAVAQKAFTLPVIALPGNGTAFVNNLKSLVLKGLNVGLMLYPAESTHTKSLAESTKTGGRFLSFRSFGKAQAPVFDGLHEGRPLFQISC